MVNKNTITYSVIGLLIGLLLSVPTFLYNLGNRVTPVLDNFLGIPYNVSHFISQCHGEGCWGFDLLSCLVWPILGLLLGTIYARLKFIKTK